MSAKTISIINYKGGVGKTVSTFNIAFGFAFFNNFKVLVVDLDPQCSLSTICINAVNYTNARHYPNKPQIDISKIPAEQTINSVIKDYLSTGSNNPNIDLGKIINKLPYTRYSGSLFHNVDFIPATMYDDNNSKHEKGLDDLEIDIVRNYANQISHINLITIFSRFFLDTKINNLYDIIIFDCPPANNIITQNALAVSDYYLIPTIMDNLSSNGINHLKNLIEQSIFEEVYHNNKGIIDRAPDNSQYAFLKTPPKLLGIFETLRKTQIKYNSRSSVKERFGNLLFEQIIYHHKPTADCTVIGRSCFSVNINENRQEYSPHVNYGKLVLELMKRMNIQKLNNDINETTWL